MKLVYILLIHTYLFEYKKTGRIIIKKNEFGKLTLRVKVNTIIICDTRKLYIRKFFFGNNNNKKYIFSHATEFTP